jgi:hypothetical protein
MEPGSLSYFKSTKFRNYKKRKLNCGVTKISNTNKKSFKNYQIYFRTLLFGFKNKDKNAGKKQNRSDYDRARYKYYGR